MASDLDRWLDELTARGGSDLHLATGNHPIIRLHGRLEALDQQNAPLSAEAITAAIAGVVGEDALDRLRHTGELDAAFERKDGTRLRTDREDLKVRSVNAEGFYVGQVPSKQRPSRTLCKPRSCGRIKRHGGLGVWRSERSPRSGRRSGSSSGR